MNELNTIIVDLVDRIEKLHKEKEEVLIDNALYVEMKFDEFKENVAKRIISDYRLCIRIKKGDYHYNNLSTDFSNYGLDLEDYHHLLEGKLED